MMTDEPSKAGDDLRKRFKAYSLRIISLCSSLPRAMPADVIGRQIMRPGTSVGAQYREACRARSTAEFISKIESALQELDETDYWLDLLAESGLVKPVRLGNLSQETNELIAILVTSARTAKRTRTKER